MPVIFSCSELSPLDMRMRSLSHLCDWSTPLVLYVPIRLVASLLCQVGTRGFSSFGIGPFGFSSWLKSYRSWEALMLSLPEQEVESSNKRSSRSIGRSRYGLQKEINPLFSITFIISRVLGLLLRMLFWWCSFRDALVAPGRETSNSSPKALDIVPLRPLLAT